MGPVIWDTLYVDNSSLLSEQEVNIPIQELSVDGVDGRMLFRLFCLLNDVCFLDPVGSLVSSVLISNVL